MLDVKDLKVHYGKIEAVRGISFHLDEQDFICIIGANGAGKTTAIKAISGLREPTCGEITFQGKKIKGMTPEKISKLGIIQVPEGRRIFSDISVLENLLVGAYVTSDKKKRSQRLEMVFQHFPRLKDRTKQMGGTLSGGEQQMLAFGRALMADPKLLMLDEPTLGLSPLMVKECARFAADVNRDGVAVILVEQNAKLALAISKRAYVMENGAITLEGPSLELANSDYVKKAYLGLS